MSAPRLRACVFGLDQSFHRMAAVLEASAAEQCSGWDVRVETIAASQVEADVVAFGDNTHKLDWWGAQVRAADDGDRLVLMDADTMILRSLDPIWADAFDIAYTVRPAFQVPFNAGVLFLRITPQVRAFVEEWIQENHRFLREPFKPWRTTFGGVNQASLAVMLRRVKELGVQLRPVPCREWNCEHSSMKSFDPAVTRIVHINGELRRALFQPQSLQRPTPETRHLATVWQAIEARSQQNVRTA